MKTTTYIPPKDVEIIARVVELFSYEGYHGLKRHLIKIFGKDITVDHYITMGEVIGLKAATDKKAPNKQTTLWQKPQLQ